MEISADRYQKWETEALYSDLMEGSRRLLGKKDLKNAESLNKEYSNTYKKNLQLAEN